MNGNNHVKKRFLLIAAVGIAAVLCALLYALWTQGFLLPLWAKWNHINICDSTGEYEIVLQHRSVDVLHHGQILWSTPNEVKVQDVLSSDIDGDAADELILLCWKRGRYGKHKPFWVEKDENGWSQHIFVYEYQAETITPKWMSSYIGQDVTAISAKETALSRSRLLLTDREENISSWIWDSWGFVKEETDVSFVVFGDNLIHEPIYRYGLQSEEGFGFLFEKVQETISASDVAVINQETPLVDRSSLYGDYPRFGTPIQVGWAIADAGFDVVTCGTNHALDRGAEGVQITKDFFDSQNILCLGIQTKEETGYRPYEILEKNGVRFALLNYTYGTNGIQIPEANPYMVHLLENEDQVREDISRAEADADFTIVFVHWGTENSETIDAFQKQWAQVFLKSKVDVVVGTHPHALQPYEVMKDDDGHQMLIYYSIGNYISAQNEKECIKGGMASFTVSLTSSGYQVTEYDLHPLKIKWQKGGRYTAEF